MSTASAHSIQENTGVITRAKEPGILNFCPNKNQKSLKTLVRENIRRAKTKASRRQGITKGSNNSHWINHALLKTLQWLLVPSKPLCPFTVFNLGFFFPGDFWQCLETFRVVTTGEVLLVSNG